MIVHFTFTATTGLPLSINSSVLWRTLALMYVLSRHCVPLCPSSYPYYDEGYFNFVCLFIVYFVFVRSIFCLFVFSNFLDLVKKDTIRREKRQWRWPLCAREKLLAFR